MVQAELNENLIRRIAEGNQQAFTQVYRATDSAVYGLAFSILKNHHDAEDVMHDTYIRIFRSAKDYQPMGKPMAWILKITKNLCLNRLRDRKPEAALEDISHLADEAADISAQAENGDFLNTAFLELSEDERQIVTLHALCGWKHRETADFLSLPLPTVLSKYRRALKKMKAVLDK